MVRESDVRASIRQAVTRSQCLVVSLHGSAFTGKGWPDLLILVGPSPYRPLFLEVKKPNGAYRPGQPETIRSLRRKGIPAWGVRNKTQALFAVQWVRKHGGQPMAANDFGAELDLDMDWLKDLDSLEVPVENEGTDEEPETQPAQSVGVPRGQPTQLSLADELEQAFGPPVVSRSQARDFADVLTGAREMGPISKETTASGQPKLEFQTPDISGGQVSSPMGPVPATSGYIQPSAPPPNAFSTGVGILERMGMDAYAIATTLAIIKEQNDQIIALLKGDTPDEDPLEEDPLPEPPVVRKRRGKAKA